MGLRCLLPGRVASAAVFAFFVGTAAAGAAVDQRTLALAGLANDVFDEYFAYPQVADLAADNPGFAAEQFLRRAGAASVGLKTLGTPDERVAAAALAGRALALSGEKQRGRVHLEAALAEAVVQRWSDARANGILRDLAWLAGAGGDTEAAGRYAARAETCPIPCADDAVAALRDTARAAHEATLADLPSNAYRQVRDLADANGIAFIEAEFGAQSLQAADAWLSRGYGIEDDRPWHALDYLQRSIDIRRAAGLPESALIETRRGIAELLLEGAEYVRLDTYAETLAADALAALSAEPDNNRLVDAALAATRLRARALWHLKDDRARAAFGMAIDLMFRFKDSDVARILLQDLIDARYDDEAARVGMALVDASPGDKDASLALGRVAARAGRYNDAAAWLSLIKQPDNIVHLQRASYLDRAGRAGDAAFLRQKVTLTAGELSWGGLNDLIDPRDYGAYEGAAAVAETYLSLAEGMIAGGTYVDAQRLWQIAYTLALGGETANSFRLMKEAASIAARLSFADANDTDGGSLQLLRRDRFRYLLFVDIAWAAFTGAPPDSMSVSSRY